VLHDGRRMMPNSKSAQPIFAPGHYATPTEDAYTKKYDEEAAKGLYEENANIAKGAVDATKGLANVNTLRSVFSNPQVYQGAGGELVQTGKKLLANFDPRMAKEVADGDVANALSRNIALTMVNPNDGSSKLLPGSMSDSDRQFVVSMATGLNNTQDANMRLLDIYQRSHERAKQLDEARKSYSKDNGGRLNTGWLDRKTELANKWAEEDRAREAAAVAPAAPQQPTAAPKGPLAPGAYVWDPATKSMKRK
jgi:hypothetical protein